jgi:hypothetical protein
MTTAYFTLTAAGGVMLAIMLRFYMNIDARWKNSK